MNKIEQLKTWALSNMGDDFWEHSEADIVNSMRDHHFAPLVGVPRYEKIRPQDVVPDGESVAFEVRAYPENLLPQAAWLVLVSIRSRMPEASVAVREHRGYVAQHGSVTPVVVRLSALVTLKVGEISMSREYAL